MAFLYKYYDQLIESEVALSLRPGDALGSRCLGITRDLTLTNRTTGATEYIVRQNEIEIRSQYYAAVFDIAARVLRLSISPNLSAGVLTQSLIDEVFPIASFFDGALQLHASAVCYGDEATCFLGHSGAGKSSLAASLVSRGYALLEDDRVLLRFENREVKVFGSGHPLRLICGSENCFDLGNWQNIGRAGEGKLRLVPPIGQSRSSGTCRQLVLLRVGESFQLSRSRLALQLLPVLECVLLSWFFSEHYGELFMRLLERFFYNPNFLSLIRASGSDALDIGSKIDALLKELRFQALMLESTKRFV